MTPLYCESGWSVRASANTSNHVSIVEANIQFYTSPRHVGVSPPVTVPCFSTKWRISYGDCSILDSIFPCPFLQIPCGFLLCASSRISKALRDFPFLSHICLSFASCLPNLVPRALSFPVSFFFSIKEVVRDKNGVRSFFQVPNCRHCSFKILTGHCNIVSSKNFTMAQNVLYLLCLQPLYQGTQFSFLDIKEMTV